MEFTLGAETGVAATKAAATVVLFPLGAALGATTGLIGETLLCVEFLLRRSKGKLGATVTAGQALVLIH